MSDFFKMNKKCHLFALLLLLAGANLLAQKPDVKFTIGSLNDVLYNDSDKSKLPQITVEIEGTVDKDKPCFLVVNDIKVSCQEVQGKGKYTISHNGENGDVNTSPPYWLFVEYDSKTSFKVPIGEVETDQGNGNNHGATKLQQEKKENLYILKNLQGPPIVWRDAWELHHALEKGSKASVDTILKKYVKEPKKYSYEGFLKETNVYLQTILPDSSSIISIENSQQSSENKIQANTGESRTLFDPTIALDAIGTLIAERLMDELNMAYLDDFRTTLNSKASSLSTFLPNTTTLLSGIGTTYTINYKSLLPNLRKTLDEDFEALPANGKRFLISKKDNIAIPDEYVLMYSLLQIVEDVLNQKQEEDILGQFQYLDYGLSKGETSHLQYGIKLFSMISNHLREGPKAGKWIKPFDILNNPSKIYLFIGLLLELEKTTLNNWQVKESNGQTSVYDLINNQDSDGKAYTTFLYKGLSLIDEVKELTTGINQDGSREKNLTIYIAFLKRVTDLISALPEKLNLKTVTNHASIAIDIFEDIANKDYVTAVTQLSHLLKLSAVDAKTHEKLLKYITFAQNLIDAKDRDELLAALEDAADPVGSYRHKRTLPLTVSVTAFPGLTFGREKYTSGVNNNTAINNLGFTAPIGLALSFSGSKGPQDNKASFTFFAPILDVGTVTAFRLNNDSAEIPELKWENFFAPGLIAQYGFKNSPMSAYFGFQYGPSASSTLTQTTRLPRFNAGISVDLHLYSIYNKPKKQKDKTPTPKKPKTRTQKTK